MRSKYHIWKSSAVRPDKAVTWVNPVYDRNARLAELINGKRIAFVCPSPHLTGLNTGELIDNYDIVVRVGNLDFMPENMYADYGKRTDILVHSFNQLEIEVAYENIDFLTSLKFVLCSMVSTDFINAHNYFFSKLNFLGVPSQNVNDRHLYWLFKQIGTIANCGFAGLLILLNYDVKEIYVTGMSFYNMGKYGKIYNPDYYNTVTTRSNLYKPNNGQLVSASDARSDLHNQEQQINYFVELLKREPRIKLDEYLTNNLPK